MRGCRLWMGMCLVSPLRDLHTFPHSVQVQRPPEAAAMAGRWEVGVKGRTRMERAASHESLIVAIAGEFLVALKNRCFTYSSSFPIILMSDRSQLVNASRECRYILPFLSSHPKHQLQFTASSCLSCSPDNTHHCTMWHLSG